MCALQQGCIGDSGSSCAQSTVLPAARLYRCGPPDELAAKKPVKQFGTGVEPEYYSRDPNSVSLSFAISNSASKMPG